MRLYGAKIKLDPRSIVSFARDISLLSEDEYQLLNPPSTVEHFPSDLSNPNLEYSGIYEDGWVSEDAFFVLKQSTLNSYLNVKGMLPKIDKAFTNSTITLILDGQQILKQKLEPGEFNLKIPLHNKMLTRNAPQSIRKKVEFHFTHLQKLPHGDNRPVAARINFIGFV